MCDPSSLKMESSVLIQCLDFSRQMESNQKPFKLKVKLSNGFSFIFNNLNQDESKFRREETKKKSPSTIRRNAARKQKFIEKKNLSSVDNEVSKKSEDTSKVETSIQELETFQCDHCDYQVNCQVLLRKHMDKEHKLIPQLDGLEDLSSKEQVPCPLCKGSEEVPDFGSCGRWGAHGCGWGGGNCVTCHLVFNIKGAHGCKAICDDLVKTVCKRCYMSFRNHQ